MHQFRTEGERITALTEKEKEAVLGIDPAFASVKQSVYFDNYDLPCPILVTVARRDGGSAQVVVRKGRHGDVGKEARIFGALREYGLPVPDVLVPPFRNEHGEDAAVYSFLRGENLQKLGMESDEKLDEAKNLLIAAVDQLTGATNFIARHEVASLVPRRTLADELAYVKNSRSPWLNEELFREALRHLERLLPAISAPLIFSNGDYQPGNFLASDGVITGFLDFESPVFQDPLMGFVKYPIYDMIPLSRTDLIDIFLSTHAFSQHDFRPRLALGCLKTLVKEISVSGGDEEMRAYRNRVLDLLRGSISR